MGAQEFYEEAHGDTVEKAFWNAVGDAQFEHGHGGYTGTIAEKMEFTLIELPEGRKPEEYAQELIDAGDKRVSDKWGPAGCFDLGEGRYFFFGLASS